MSDPRDMTDAQLEARIKELLDRSRESIRKLAASKRSNGDIERAEALERMLVMNDTQFEAALELMGGRTMGTA